MAIKREMSDSEPEVEVESGSDFEPEDEVDIKPTPSKKTKTQQKTQPKTPGSSQKKRPAPSPHSGSSTESPSPTKKVHRVADGAKRTIAEKVIQSGIVAVDVEELATITGLTIRQVKSQLEGNRSNVRKQLMDLARGL